MIVDLKQRYEKPLIANAFNIWVDIRAPIRMVFQYLTQAPDLNRWWAWRCRSDPRPGGKLHAVWKAEQEIVGEAVFRQYEPPHRVIWEWTHRNGEPITCDGSDPRGMRWPALNIFELACIDESTTRLHLHDLGIHAAPAYENIRQASQIGWHHALTALKRILEQRHGQRLLHSAHQSPTGEEAEPPPGPFSENWQLTGA